MPNTDPVQILISQGYPPATAQKMVDSGAYDAISAANKPLFPAPTSNNTAALPGITAATTDVGAQSEFSRDPEIQDLIDQGYTREEAQQMRAGDQLPTEGGTNPDLQPFLDQGYNEEEASQLAQSSFYNQAQNEVPVEQKSSTLSAVTDVLDFGTNLAGTSSMEGSAYGLGQAIGSEKGGARTLGIVGNAGKLAFSSARNIASGIGQAKRNQYVQEYADKKRQEGTGRETYTAAPQTQNSNYLGGNSFGEEGGTQGKNLPLKNFLTNKGFKKPGYKKL